MGSTRSNIQTKIAFLHFISFYSTYGVIFSEYFILKEASVVSKLCYAIFKLQFERIFFVGNVAIFAGHCHYVQTW